jgi:hypothetical protein
LQSVPWFLRKTQNTRPNPAINEYFIRLKYSFKVMWIIGSGWWESEAGMLNQAMAHAR